MNVKYNFRPYKGNSRFLISIFYGLWIRNNIIKQIYCHTCMGTGLPSQCILLVTLYYISILSSTVISKLAWKESSYYHKYMTKHKLKSTASHVYFRKFYKTRLIISLSGLTKRKDRPRYHSYNLSNVQCLPL